MPENIVAVPVTKTWDIVWRYMIYSCPDTKKDGRAMIPGTNRPILHAVRSGDYFTHAGGLVAAHPSAHFIAHNSELLAWLLRREAFLRLRFDPDVIFGRRT